MENKTLYKILTEYAKNGRYPLHMPGHKRNAKFLEDMDIYDIDITEIEGFDNLHHAKGIIKDAMERAANFYHTKRTWFLVNGSTCGILAAISATTKIGDQILIGRNCHKSVYHAAELLNLQVEYIYPEIIKEYGIYGGYSPEKICKILDENREIKVVVLTSPTYEGIVSDIKRIAEIVHERNGILIVDEAHGAHFGLRNQVPTPAYRLGADLVIESLHKTLPAMTQTAVMHLIGDRVREEEIEKYLDVFETSSPSYVMMASIDSCIESVKQSGKHKMETLISQIKEYRKEAVDFKNLRIPGKELIGRNAVFDVDETKLVMDVGKTAMSGKELADILREQYHFEVEMAEKTFALAICTICDNPIQLKRLFECLKKIDEQIKSESEFGKTEENLQNAGQVRKDLKNEGIYSIYETTLKPSEEINLSEAAGRISGEYIYVYPPGIPLIVPGEKISEALITQVISLKRSGMAIQGLEDKEGERIRVVKE